MKFLELLKDGGKESTVWGVFIVEIKWLFSIVVLHFENGSREAYHNHAFNSISWVLRGMLVEYMVDGRINVYTPSLIPIITGKTDFHKVVSEGDTFVLSFRGPWRDLWREFIPATNEYVVLTHGRKELVRFAKGVKG